MRQKEREEDDIFFALDHLAVDAEADCPTIEEIHTILSQEEDSETKRKEIKRERNRASAKASRQREKKILLFLREKCDLLEKENAALRFDRQSYALLRADNVRMHQILTTLRMKN